MTNKNNKKHFVTAADLLNLEIEKCIEDCFDREVFFNRHNNLGEHRLNGKRVKIINVTLSDE